MTFRVPRNLHPAKVMASLESYKLQFQSQGRRGQSPASYHSAQFASPTSSTSSLRSKSSFNEPEQPHCSSSRYRTRPAGSSRYQAAQDWQPPHQFHFRNSSRENSISDSEQSIGSFSNLSAFSECSEMRGVFLPLGDQAMRPSALEHYNQLKIKPGTRVSEKTKQILYRPKHFESDSSSSLAESTDSLNNKQRELEHYNKLKLNLDNISGNKRALIGK